MQFLLRKIPAVFKDFLNKNFTNNLEQNNHFLIEEV